MTKIYFNSSAGDNDGDSFNGHNWFNDLACTSPYNNQPQAGDDLVYLEAPTVATTGWMSGSYGILDTSAVADNINANCIGHLSAVFTASGIDPHSIGYAGYSHGFTGTLEGTTVANLRGTLDLGQVTLFNNLTVFEATADLTASYITWNSGGIIEWNATTPAVTTLTVNPSSNLTLKLFTPMAPTMLAINSAGTLTVRPQVTTATFNVGYPSWTGSPCTIDPGDITGGGGTIPAASDVRNGVAVGSGNGTAYIPAASDVRLGTPVDAGAGTLHVPSATDVLLNINVDATVGSLTLPSTANVRHGTVYGVAGNGSTGSAYIPSASDVRSGTNVDATTGTCHVPTASQVLNGVAVDATTGNVVLPIASVVLAGITYGASSGTTGTLAVDNTDIASILTAVNAINTEVLAVKAKTDNLPADPASNTQVNTRSTYAGADTSGTTTLLSRLTNTRATNLDNLDAAVSTRLATSGYTAPAVPGSAMTLTSGERNAVADAHLDRAGAIDGITPRQAQQIVGAGVTGLLSGATDGTDPDTIVLKGFDKTTTRATITADQNGNRTAITYNTG